MSTDAVFGQQMEQVGPTEESQWLSICELVWVRSVVRGSHQNSLAGAFVHDGSIQISHGGHADGVRVPFCLNNDFPAAYWIWVERYCVDTAVSAGLRYLYLAAG